jgi:hypothetical protein
LAACRFGWGCTREGCWHEHEHGREIDGDPHPIAGAAMRADPARLAARAARFTATEPVAKEDESAAAASHGSRIAHAGGKISTNKAEALRLFYVRLLRGGQVPTEAQRQTVTAAGLDLAALDAEVAAEAKEAAGAPTDKEAVKAALRKQLEEAASRRAKALQGRARGAVEAGGGSTGGGGAVGVESPSAKRYSIALPSPDPAATSDPTPSPRCQKQVCAAGARLNCRCRAGEDWTAS